MHLFRLSFYLHILRPIISITILSSFFLLVGCLEDNPSQIAGNIIGTFAGSCSAAGPWSQRANANTEALIQIFKELKNKDKCQNLGSILDLMTNTAQSIHSAYSDYGFLGYRQKEEEIQELTLVLTKTTDSELRSVLTAAIIDRQRDLAIARAARTTERQTLNKVGPLDQYSMMTGAIANNFGTLFSYQGQLSECMQQSPASALSVVTNLASIGGSFASPALGANMNVLSGALSQFLGFLRISKIDNTIFDLYEGQMPAALTCGLESMTDFYCQAEDANEIVLNQAQSLQRPNPPPPQNFWRGINLLSRYLPVLNLWLLKTRAGLTPQNEFESKRMQQALNKRRAIDIKELSVLGKLNQARNLIESAPEEATKKAELIKVVSRIAEELSGSTARFSPGNDGDVTDPFHEAGRTSLDYACQLTKGEQTKTCSDKSDSQVYAPNLISFIEKIYLERPFNIATVQIEGWPGILNLVRAQVINEFNSIIFIDPTILLSSAHENTSSNISPRDGLVEIYNYLLELKSEAESNHRIYRLPSINEALRIVTKAIEIIDTVVGVFNSENDSRLVEIYNEFKLDNGVEYFTNRLSNLVQFDLYDRMSAGELPGNIADIILSSGEEILRRLTAAGYDDHAAILSDLGSAKNQTAANFRIFRKFFSIKIGEIIEKQYELSIEIGENLSQGVARSYGQRIAHLCMLLYATSNNLNGENWPTQKTEKICKNSVYFSAYPDPNGDRKIRIGDLPTYLSKWDNEPLTKNRMKICAFYNFKRAERLYQVLHRPPMSPDNSLLRALPSSINFNFFVK